MGNVRKPYDEEMYLEQGMDLINRQRQRVSPPPLLNGTLSITECPLIDRVRKTLLHALLERKGAGSGHEADSGSLHALAGPIRTKQHLI